MASRGGAEELSGKAKGWGLRVRFRYATRFYAAKQDGAIQRLAERTLTRSWPDPGSSASTCCRFVSSDSSRCVSSVRFQSFPTPTPSLTKLSNRLASFSSRIRYPPSQHTAEGGASHVLENRLYTIARLTNWPAAMLARLQPIITRIPALWHPGLDTRRVESRCFCYTNTSKQDL